MGPFRVAQIDLQEHWNWFNLPRPPEKAPEANLHGSSAPPKSHYFLLHTDDVGGVSPGPWKV